MIMPLPLPSKQPKQKNVVYIHTLSDKFLTAMVQAAEALHNRDDAWKEIIRSALEDEFPEDQEMKKFAEDNFSDIVRFLMDDNSMRS